jgi:hypothetical protein
MIPEFLAFRYEGVRRIDEILAKPSDVGWKCRRYIKWRDVHNSKTDANALYTFAEDLLDKGKFRKDLYGTISAVCLNVQKWRLDKEKLSVDPPGRKEWERRDVLFKAVKNNAGLIPARLAEHRVTIDTLTSSAIQVLFYACELDSFFRAQNIEGYPAEPISKGLLGEKESTHAKLLLQRFAIPYQYFGLNRPKAVEASEVIAQVASDLGFAAIVIDPKLAIPTRTTQTNAEALVELVPMEKFKIIQVENASGIAHIRINSQHRFIASLVHGGKLDPRLATFLKAYGSSMLSMAGSLDTLETFNSYLGLELHTATSP